MIGRILFFIRLFIWFSLRDMRRHPGRASIVIIGIAMGAAVFASVRLSIDATMDLSLIHISEPTRQPATSRMPTSA